MHIKLLVSNFEGRENLEDQVLDAYQSTYWIIVMWKFRLDWRNPGSGNVSGLDYSVSGRSMPQVGEIVLPNDEHLPFQEIICTVHWLSHFTLNYQCCLCLGCWEYQCMLHVAYIATISMLDSSLRGYRSQWNVLGQTAGSKCEDSPTLHGLNPSLKILRTFTSWHCYLPENTSLKCAWLKENFWRGLYCIYVATWTLFITSERTHSV